MSTDWVSDIQLKNKPNEEVQFLLCACDIFSKYSGVILSKNETGIIFTNFPQKVLNESDCKPKKILVDKFKWT